MQCSFALDISGMLPNQDSVLGLVAFPVTKKEYVFKRFKNKFSGILRKKGKSLKRKDLYKMLSFLDENHVKMVGVKCTKHNWNRRFSNLPKNASYRREKLYGILYFIALSSASKKNLLYDVVLCKDSFMRTEKAITACKKLADYHRYIYNFSIATEKHNLGIKIADYVAAAGRKIRPMSLETDFKNYKIISTNIPYKYVRYIFDLY